MVAMLSPGAVREPQRAPEPRNAVCRFVCRFIPSNPAIPPFYWPKSSCTKGLIPSARGVRLNNRRRQTARLARGETASPRNTRTAWLSRRISSLSSRLARCPQLARLHHGLPLCLIKCDCPGGSLLTVNFPAVGDANHGDTKHRAVEGEHDAPIPHP